MTTATKAARKTSAKKTSAKKGTKKTSAKKASKQDASTKAPTKKSAKKAPPTKKRSVEHEKPHARVAQITGKIMKQILGYSKAPDGVKEGVYTIAGDKVFLTNNVHNRPIYKQNVEDLKQEILRGFYRLNGEPIIIGKTGILLDGQHTGVALLEAIAAYDKRPEKYPAWNEEPYIEKVLVYGIDESDETVNTMNTGRPRSLMDVIYRSQIYANVAQADRAVISRMLEYAVKLLWERTGVTDTAFAPRFTHSEAIGFIERHSRILGCVQHIFEEMGNGGMKNYISPGNAAAMMYLMASSATDGENCGYEQSIEPDESYLDFSMYEKASEFFVQLCQENNPMFKHLKEAHTAITDEGGTASRAQKLALIAKAWLRYAEDKNITPSSLELLYEQDDFGLYHLAETPTVGGIDIGKPTGVKLSIEDADETEESTEESADETMQESE